jgi:predicted nuclease of restriction endonuclease-like RecB superfamily
VLTRDLLLFRVREGRLRPSFVKREDPELLALAKELIAEVEGAKGQTRDDVEEALALRAGAFSRPRVARGLVKLLVDRALFDEAAEGVTETRWGRFQVAAQVLRGLSLDTTLEAYEARLAEALPAPLPEVREALYEDLPGNRRLLGWEALTPTDLLDRYNLALAQGPLLGARRLTLRARAPELLRVRKLLRWLKFCRLVAEVRRDGDDWALEVEGPGALLSLQKKYGLQLASFLSVVPVLERWELTAEVEASARRRAMLVLDHRDPLVSPLPAALGHIPAEVATLAEGFEDAEWEVDLTALPRHMGAAGLCVPDLTFRHRETGREVALELFHAWHAGPLARRLGELRSRPDPGLLLGVDRALAKGEERDALEAHPRVVLFNGFPSARRLRERLGRLIEEPTPAGA